MERVKTGNATLDYILEGGFPRNSINIVMGRPGSGKTILTQQLAFANADEDRPVLYLTTLSEPLPKMLGYLQELTFSDIGRVGSSIFYEGLDETLAKSPDELHDRVLDLIQQHRPRVLVIDSFKAIADLMPDTPVWRKMVFELANLLSAYDTTSFWIGEYGSSDPDTIEFAIADGILELWREQSGTRDDRYLRVGKLRGSGFFDGSHAFTIGADGLRVFPRLVAPPMPRYQPVPARLRSGVGGLDAMVESGWLSGTSTLVAGPSGAGKTIVGLHFLRQGVQDGEPGLLVNFQENPVQLRRTMTSLGWEPEQLIGPGRLDVLYTSPVELHIDSIVGEMFRRIEENGVQRVFIDALSDVEKASRDPRRFRDYVYSLTQHFAARNVTAMLALESSTDAPHHSLTGHDVSYMSDNILLLTMELEEELTRTIRVMKSRGSAHDGKRHLLRIVPGGVLVQ